MFSFYKLTWFSILTPQTSHFISKNREHRDHGRLGRAIPVLGRLSKPSCHGLKSTPAEPEAEAGWITYL